MSESGSIEKGDQKEVKALANVVMLRGNETPEQLKEKIDWKAIENYELLNENGVKVPFKYVYEDCKTIIIFIRVCGIDGLEVLCTVSAIYYQSLHKLQLIDMNYFSEVPLPCRDF